MAQSTPTAVVWSSAELLVRIWTRSRFMLQEVTP